MVTVDRTAKNTVYQPYLMDQLVMFGDSITQFAWQPGGMGQRLADAYQRRLDVVNRGYSGYNTAWALEVAKSVFPTEAHPTQKFPIKRLVTLWFGANDAVIPPKPQHVSEEQFVANLKTLIDILQEHGRQTGTDDKPVQIVLITPPPVSVSMRAADCAKRFPDWKPENMDRDPARTKKFAELVVQVAKEKSLPVIDVWTAITKASENADGGLAKYLSDGLHLTPDGYEIVTNDFTALLNRQFPHLMPEQIKNDFPWWNDIDYKDPKRSFPQSSTS